MQTTNNTLNTTNNKPPMANDKPLITNNKPLIANDKPLIANDATGSSGTRKTPIIKILQDERNLPVDQTWKVEDIITKFPPRGWEEIFTDAMDEISAAGATVEHYSKEYGSFYPLKKHLFRAFEVTPLDQVKVVLVGQDPYPALLSNGCPRAQGLSFSVSKDDEIPASLRNMYKELSRSVTGFTPPNHGDLSSWAQQGVLLLNMSLTFQPGFGKNQAPVWSGFLSKILDAIAAKRPGVVYLLLGRDAQKMRSMINGKMTIIEAPHPSSRNIKGGFIGSNVFNLTNNALKEHGMSPINWQIR